MADESKELTVLLNRAAGGDAVAGDEAFGRVYERLRSIASAATGRSRDGTLHATALVHEAYMKLFAGASRSWADRGHFFAVAARAMRQIAVDHARSAAAAKRGGGWSRVACDDPEAKKSADLVDILALDEALGRLADLSPRQASVVELRFFGGLKNDEAAEVIGVSPRTAELDWRAARAWLRAELAGKNDRTPGDTGGA